MLEHLLQAVVEDPLSEDRYLVLADWLEENDDPRRAELLRLHRRLIATCCEPERHPERSAWQARVVALVTDGVRPCVPQRTLDLGAGIAITFSFIPPGSFLIGSPESEEGRREGEGQRLVKRPRGFWMGTYQVTQAQWRAVLGTRPSQYQGDSRPVEHVTWQECVNFCGQLGEGFRLPSEAEWEYACRAGTTTAYHTGDGSHSLSLAGWCNHDGTFGTSTMIPPGYADYRVEASTKPVGGFAPNAWGLFDVHGNVWEWCQDWYVTAPALTRRWKRVLRGGCYFNDPPHCRSANRTGGEPDLHVSSIGCRVCWEST